MATILVVDDSPVAQRVLSLILERKGHHILAVSSGYEALEALLNQSITLAIIDLAMPEMDGLTLLRAIRSYTDHPELPIIMLTASGLDRDRLQADEAGVSGFLTKPASSREVIEMVSRFVA